MQPRGAKTCQEINQIKENVLWQSRHWNVVWLRGIRGKTIVRTATYNNICIMQASLSCSLQKPTQNLANPLSSSTAGNTSRCGGVASAFSISSAILNFLWKWINMIDWKTWRRKSISATCRLAVEAWPRCWTASTNSNANLWTTGEPRSGFC